MPQLLPVPNSAYQLVAILGGLAVLRTIFIAIRSQYRLRFHPLAKFPGPKEACISDDWEYGLCKQPQAFPERIYEELHEKYNTRALRIRPNELHISDPKLYSVIYNQTTNFYKYPPFYEGFNTPHTLFAETDPVLHRERRKLLNPMFSRTGVFKLEPIIHEKYAMLERKIRRLCKNQNIDIFMALRCMTMDVISEFAFARSTGKIDECPDGFKCELLESLDVAASILTHSQHNAFLRFIISITPPFIVRKMNKDVGRVLDFLDFARSSVEHWRQHSDKVSHPVVFDRLKTLTTEYQATEAVDILVAGTDTTAFTLTRGIAMITGNPEIQNKLVNALREGLSSEPSGKPIELLKLEKIDYLIGCVKESLRFALPVPGRLPRVVPGGNAPPFIVDGQVVPPGTTVGISAYTVHFSKEIWGPDAREFRPERWMGPDSKSLEQYLVTFSKGSRMCIGQNVAHAEMTIILANLFYNFKISRPYNWKDPVATDAFNSALFDQTVDLVFEPITNGI